MISRREGSFKILRRAPPPRLSETILGIFSFLSPRNVLGGTGKKAGRAQSIDPLNSHGDFVDSSEKSRPNKRNRAQISINGENLFFNRAQEAVNNDLFSLNRILDQVIKEKDKDGGGVVQEEAPPVSGFTPTPLSEFCFDLNDKVGSSKSGGFGR
ncbi:hypothetical protein Hanom_Chr06g00483981 [Helianthus anomalus]